MLKSKIIFFLSFFFITSSLVNAQLLNSVKLKNGSILYGKIIEHRPDSIIKIKDRCGNLWAFQYTEIESFNGKYKTKKEHIEPAIPFQFGFELGVAAFGGYYDPGLSFILSGKYALNDRISVGISTGAEYFEIPLLPAAGEIHLDIFKRRATPYLYVKGGYGFKLLPDEANNEYTSKYRGGPLFGAGIGIKKRFNPEFAMTFSIGYRHQQTFEERDYLFEDWWRSDYTRQYFMNRTAFKIGFVF